MDTDDRILTEMPYFIAVNFRRVLHAETDPERVRWALHTYNLGLRALTIGLISQYLIRDKDQVSDPYLNQLLIEKFPLGTLDGWFQLLFATLHAYENSRDLLFMPELYDFYWASSPDGPRARDEVEKPFARLTQIAVEIESERIVPQTDSEWHSLAKETLSLLRKVLASASFICEYDLIRVVDVNTQHYKYELHRGLEIPPPDMRPLPRYMTLDPGWFYLRADTGEFLELHPLFVSWEDETESTEQPATDIGVYDKYFTQELQYLLATFGEYIKDQNATEPFDELLFKTIERTKQRFEIKGKLTWWQLRDFCAEISRNRTATVADKYRPELYLERDKTRQAFETFLNGGQRCFVLTGKSGVGKSNFFLALSHELQRSHSSDICVLMYDGGNLAVNPSYTITEVISKDFDDRLVRTGHRIEDIWREIEKIDGIDKRKVLLLIDAINENLQAKELLRQLDELVQSPWSWLKVVFSSRPETWQTISQGIQLSKGLYYRETGTDEFGIELEAFSYAEQMDTFSVEELSHVYERHRSHFALETDYSEIPLHIRKILRDPLSLWLVCSTRAGDRIPPDTKVTQVIQEYIEASTKNGMLKQQDVDLLTCEVVPLMLQDGHHKNRLTIADIDAAGGTLYQSIYSEQILSDGWQVNQSFHNLLNAEILATQGEGRAQTIVFKYERFYEYFVGGALHALLGTPDTWRDQYATWLGDLEDAPFLWGAMRVCLLRQLQDLDTQLAGKLCSDLARLDNQRMIDMLIIALTEAGNDDLQKTIDILELLLARERGSWLQRLRREKVEEQHCPGPKLVAIAVAGNLGLAEQLETALVDPSEAVRSVAVRQTYVLWRRESETGFRLLEKLAVNSVRKFGIPRLNEFQSCTALSLLILFDDFRSEGTTDRLLAVWGVLIEKLLHINSNKLGSRSERAKSWLRTVLLSLAANTVLRTVRMGSNNGLLNIPELSMFFDRDAGLQRRKRSARKLLYYLDAETTDITEIREDIADLVEQNDLLLALIAVAVLQRHTTVSPERVVPLLKEIFDNARHVTFPHPADSDVELPGPFAGTVPISVSLFAADLDAYHSSMVRELIQYFVKEVNNDFDARWISSYQEHRFTSLDILTWSEVGEKGDIPIAPTAKHYIDLAIERHDVGWMTDIIDWDAVITGVDMGYTNMGLSIIKPLLVCKEMDVQDAIVEALARMHVYHPDEVDNFVELHDLDKQLSTKIQRHSSSEMIGDLLNVRTLDFWNGAIMAESSPEFFQKVIKVFRWLPECRSLAGFLTITFKGIVNEVYGAQVFWDSPDQLE